MIRPFGFVSENIFLSLCSSLLANIRTLTLADLGLFVPYFRQRIMRGNRFYHFQQIFPPERPTEPPSLQFRRNQNSALVFEHLPSLCCRWYRCFSFQLDLPFCALVASSRSTSLDREPRRVTALRSKQVLRRPTHCHRQPQNAGFNWVVYCLPSPYDCSRPLTYDSLTCFG